MNEWLDERNDVAVSFSTISGSLHRYTLKVIVGKNGTSYISNTTIFATGAEARQDVTLQYQICVSPTLAVGTGTTVNATVPF